MCFHLFVCLVILCVPTLYSCLFYDIVRPHSNSWRWLQSEDTKKNMTSRCHYVLKISVIWDGRYLYNNGKTGPKKVCFCWFVRLDTLCVPTLHIRLFYDIVLPHSNLLRWLQSEDTKKNMTSRCQCNVSLKSLWYEMMGIYVIMERRAQKSVILFVCSFCYIVCPHSVHLFVLWHCASTL